MKIIKNKKGFTLVEAMIVVAIFGILAAVIVPQFTKGPAAHARITFSQKSGDVPETRNTQSMIQQIDLYQKQYNISEFDLPTIMRNEDQKEWYFPR